MLIFYRGYRAADHLTLPPEAVATLGLPFLTRVPADLADGSAIEMAFSDALRRQARLCYNVSGGRPIMADTTATQSMPRTDAEYQTAIAEMLTAMQQMNRQMQTDQARIEQLQAETTVLRTETRAALSRMGASF